MPIDRLGDRITDFNPTEGDSYGALDTLS